MKKYIFAIISTLLFTLIGCASEATQVLSFVSPTQAERTKQDERINLPEKIIFEEELGVGLQIDIPSLGLSEQNVLEIAYGYVQEKGEKWEVLWMASYPYDSYLLIRTKKDVILFYKLNDRTDDRSLKLYDMDGDGLDEIIIRYEVARNGLPLYRTRIFKVINDNIKEVFSITSDAECAERTGFQVELQDGWRAQIINRYFDFSLQIDLIDMDMQQKEKFFDEKGQIKNSECFLIMISDESYEIEDMDNNGVFELLLTGHIFLDSRNTLIGRWSCTWKYNEISEEIELVRAEIWNEFPGF